ncbi:Retrovirus-related Pol polyprotein [Collichthys lucidus]|uniref:Retrovirus-related Pol polyprotein n=1 Tax=Collichthys lucidus TaxID=240159 RepID=A0A4U5TVQ4_COLLU|nr:Retrovirus-related Pol polyprotein [Collichthys lucidus]
MVPPTQAARPHPPTSRAAEECRGPDPQPQAFPFPLCPCPPTSRIPVVEQPPAPDQQPTAGKETDWQQEGVGLTHLVQHEIDTSDARPIKTRQCQLSMRHQAAADIAIDEMLNTGIIEPSDSPWASGIVKVNKKRSPKMRFCVDYRPLNSVTKKDSYPLPRIDESLDLVTGSSWFSSLDLKDSGYSFTSSDGLVKRFNRTLAKLWG